MVFGGGDESASATLKVSCRVVSVFTATLKFVQTENTAT